MRSSTWPPPSGCRGRRPRLSSRSRHHRDYIEEKTGARPGDGYGPLMRLNPDVDDVVDRFGQRAPDGVRFLAMGTLSGAGGGCLCPENTLLAADRPGHRPPREARRSSSTPRPGSSTSDAPWPEGFGEAIVVTDPTYSGIGVAIAAARLARDLGIPRVHLAVNRVRGPLDEERVRTEVGLRADGVVFDSWTWLPYDDGVLAGEPSVEALLATPEAPFLTAVRALAATVSSTRTEVLT